MLTVRYFAAAAEAAGVEEEQVPALADLAALLDDAIGRHGASLARVLPACSVLLDGLTTTDRSTALDGVRTVDLLPPFAGG